MPNEPANRKLDDRFKVIMSAYCFDPEGTMEERNGWQRAIGAAEWMNVTVLYHPTKSIEQLEQHLPDWLSPGSVRFVPITHTPWSRWFVDNELTFYAGYGGWHHLAYKRALSLVQSETFHLAHTVTLCGFREPGYLWKLPIPHVWGPIGGTHNLPKRFHRALPMRSVVRESIRSAMNSFQLRFSRKVRQCAKRSALVIASTREAQKDVERAWGVRTDLDLEAGLDFPPTLAMKERDPSRPLRILWTGRLRAWKGLPLLLHALSRVPDSLAYELKIVGDGCEKSVWMELADRLGVSKRIEWVVWPTYRETLPFYDWADVFAFTSLRDTSGTGLLEALAAGTPILGLAHQGASDIMSDDSSCMIPVDNWHSTIESMTASIVRLASDHAYWAMLSQNAKQRAEQYVWRNRAERIRSMYMDALRLSTGSERANVEINHRHTINQSNFASNPELHSR